MAGRLQDVILRGLRIDQPLATTVSPGTLFYVTDEQVTERCADDNLTWEDYSDSGGGGGGGITDLTGDVTATGPGSAVATLANTAVTPGAYSNADITVDSKGRVTLAANGAGAGITELTGEVIAGPGSGSQTATIANDAITTVKIIDDAVTFAKMQNIATDSLIGRDTAGTGSPESILLNATLEFDGSGNIRRSALTGDISASAGSNTTAIAANAVTFGKLVQIPTDSLVGRDTAGTGNAENILLNATLSMDGAGNLQRAALTGDVTATAGSNATTIPAGTVTLAQIANMNTNRLLGRDTPGSGVIEEISTSTSITFSGSGTIVRSPLTGDVTAALDSNATTIANDAVTTVKILDDNVTYAKIQNVSATDRLLGRDTAAAGNIEELTATGGIEFTGGPGIQTSAFTGDVTKTAGGTALTIANNAVTTAKILDEAVTLAKIADAAANDKLLGSGNSGAGNPYAEITLGSGLTMTGTTLAASGGSGITQLTGDVTAGPGSGSQAATLANSGVTAATYQEPVSITFDAKGRATAASGWTYTISSADADLSAAVNTFYVWDISGFTANRTLTLPGTAAVGDRVRVQLSVGDITRELLITAASGDTLNAIAGGTEWSRIFITGEYLEMVCVVANTTWLVETDGRIPSQMVATLTTQCDGEAAGTMSIPTSVSTPGAWTATSDIGNIASLATSLVLVRRTNNYQVNVGMRSKDNGAAAAYMAVRALTAGSVVVQFRQDCTIPTANVRPNICASGGVRLVAADSIQYQYTSSAGSLGLEATSSCFFVVYEIL